MHVQDHPRQYAFTNLVDLVLSNPTQKPEWHPLYVDAFTGVSMTIAELRYLVPRVHATLVNDFGIQRGDRICVFSPNHMDMAPIFLGALSAGAAVSPANTSYVATELERQVSMTKARILVAHPDNLDTALAVAAKVGLSRSRVFSITPDSKGRVAYWRDVLLPPKDAQIELPSPVKMTDKESRETIAYLCFSSGTTGKSKGVMTSHYNCISMITEISELTNAWTAPVNKVTLGTMPMYHSAGLNRLLNSGITNGNTMIILDKYTVEDMCSTIERFRINDLPTAPPVLLHLLNSPIVNKYDLSSLKSFNVGSAPTGPEIVRRIMTKFDGAPCTQAYGMTETSPIAIMQTKDTVVPGSVGRLLPCMTAKVVDPDGKTLPKGSVGEVCLKGPNVMIGYLDDEESTRATIDEEGFIHTGDIGREDEEGNWYIVDRAKELIKYKGFQVAPAELEFLLLQHPAITDAAVIGVHNEEQATEMPRAFVVVNPSLPKPTAEAIQDWVKERVANHKRLRGGVQFIDAIPKSLAGKILRRELRELAQKEIAQQPVMAKL